MECHSKPTRLIRKAAIILVLRSGIGVLLKRYFFYFELVAYVIVFFVAPWTKDKIKKRETT